MPYIKRTVKGIFYITKPIQMALKHEYLKPIKK